MFRRRNNFYVEISAVKFFRFCLTQPSRRAVERFVSAPLTMSCRVNGLDRLKYMIDTLHALANIWRSELSQWTPRAYARRTRSPA